MTSISLFLNHLSGQHSETHKAECQSLMTQDYAPRQEMVVGSVVTKSTQELDTNEHHFHHFESQSPDFIQTSDSGIFQNGEISDLVNLESPDELKKPGAFDVDKNIEAQHQQVLEKSDSVELSKNFEATFLTGGVSTIALSNWDTVRVGRV